VLEGEPTFYLFRSSVSRLRLSFVRARTSVGWRFLRDGSSIATTQEK